MRGRARLQGLPRAGAPSTLHRSALQQDTGRVRPMPSTSEGTHLLAQDLVTVESPRKGYTAGMEHACQAGQAVLAFTRRVGLTWGHHPGLSPSMTQLPAFSPAPAE